MTQTDFHHAKPVYEYLPGWTEDITGARDASTTCPQNAQAYVARARGDVRCAASPRSASAPAATRSSCATT